MPSEPTSEVFDHDNASIVEGERIGSLIRLKPEYEERYIVLHAHPFPGVIEQIRGSNLRNYSIFLRNGLLFSFVEYVGTAYEADMEAMANNPTVQDWWTLTDPMQESLLPEDADEWWAPMEELYHGGPKTRPSPDTDKKAYVRRLREDTAERAAQAYAEAAPALGEAIEAARFQNYSVYGWENRLYTYAEYAGDQFATDLDRLQSSDAMQRLIQTLNPLTRSASSSDHEDSPHSMDSVFYMP